MIRNDIDCKICPSLKDVSFLVRDELFPDTTRSADSLGVMDAPADLPQEVFSNPIGSSC
jgi:hypothetical protein